MQITGRNVSRAVLKGRSCCVGTVLIDKGKLIGHCLHKEHVNIDGSYHIPRKPYTDSVGGFQL